METLFFILAIIGATYSYNFLWKLVIGDDYNTAKDLLFYFILICLALGSCKPKPKPSASPVVILADTTRLQLKRQVDSSGNVLITISKKTDSTLSEHEKVVQRYDSIRVALP